jgi:hypothetical protein
MSIVLNSCMAPYRMLKDTVDGRHIRLSGYMIWREIIASEMALH